MTGDLGSRPPDCILLGPCMPFAYTGGFFDVYSVPQTGTARFAPGMIYYPEHHLGAGE